MKQPGYILLLTLMILSISTIVVTQIFFQGSIFNLFVPLAIEREKARRIALSGVSVAIAQLALQDTVLVQKKDEKKDEEKKEKTPDRKKELLKVLLNVQGKWQTFELKQAVDGVDGQLTVCITCEEGKININKLYDFKKHEFVTSLSPDKKNDQKKESDGPAADKKPETLEAGKKKNQGEAVFNFVVSAAKSLTNNKNMFGSIPEVLKKREEPLVDVTQLISSKQMGELSDLLFLKENSSFVCLTDIFTVATDTVQVSPWILSPSLQLLLKMKATATVSTATSEKEIKKQIDELLEKVSVGTFSWEKDWNTYLKPLYKIDFESLPKELIPFLNTKFEPRLFSVLCYGKVGRVTQRLLALIERTLVDGQEVIKMKKLYWL